MRASIVGAGGQLGRALMNSAPAHWDVLGYDRRTCDVTNFSALRAMIERDRPDLLINASAYTSVDEAEANQAEAELMNTTAPGVMAAYARALGCRFLHVSTDFVFDGSAPTPIVPNAPRRPINTYGRTKAAGEVAVEEADPSATIVRTAWVYAPIGRNFVNTMLRLMREGRELRVVWDQVGTPTWAPSLATAIWSLVDRSALGTWHFTDAGIASWYDFAVAIFEEASAVGLLADRVSIHPVMSAAFQTAAQRPSYSVLDKSATWELIGEPPHWRENLRVNLRELSSHG